MRNGNVEIRTASSSGHPQLRWSPLDLFALFTESNFFYEAMGYPPGSGNPDSRLSTVTFPKHLNMTDITSPKSREKKICKIHVKWFNAVWSAAVCLELVPE